jgi:hypothetical protein
LKFLSARRPARRFPFDAAADVLVLIEPALAAFERQATLALERAVGR